MEAAGRARRRGRVERGGMLLRVLSSLVGLPLLVFFVFWRGGLPFMLGVALLTLLGLGEFYRACRKQGIRPVAWLGYAAATLFLLVAHTAGRQLVGRQMSAALTALLLVGLVSELVRKDRAPIQNLGATVLGTFYVGWLFSYLILLRHQGADLLQRVGGSSALPFSGPLADPGAWIVLLVVFSTWACDTGALLIGKAFGRHKLAPEISPGKTVEGAVGGWLCAVAMALFMGMILRLDLGIASTLGGVIGVLGQVGDLCESALKRELGIKDFGSLLPGHGGVLDRFDSLLMTAPVAYYVLSLWPT